ARGGGRTGRRALRPGGGRGRSRPGAPARRVRAPALAAGPGRAGDRGQRGGGRSGPGGRAGRRPGRLRRASLRRSRPAGARCAGRQGAPPPARAGRRQDAVLRGPAGRRALPGGGRLVGQQEGARHPAAAGPQAMSEQKSSGRGLARAAGMISVATMLSRVLGLAREQLFAILLGATPFADAFVVAFRIPNLLRDLFAEGALSQAFVPTFKTSLKRSGIGPAYALGNRVAGTMLAVIAIITLIAAAAAPEIVELMAGDFVAQFPGKFDLTVLLTRIMLPFLALVSLAAVAMGMLNAQDRYGTPALAPALFNVVCIAGGVTLWALGWDAETVAIGWAVATLAGGA